MSHSAQTDVSKFYQEFAESYNQMMVQEIQLPIYDEILNQLADRIRGVAGTVLDSSCGSGHMLRKIKDEYVPDRELIGVDISPQMVEISKLRLEGDATVFECDMGNLSMLSDDSCAAIISFYAIQHVELTTLRQCFDEWRRLLVDGGALVVAAWEGEGQIDYGDVTDVVATRYREDEIVSCLSEAGLVVKEHSVKPVDGFEMDAVFVWATKVSRSS
jgi:ubiquinone/menaquinone biosynthesis C-methylase UbiE